MELFEYAIRRCDCKEQCKTLIVEVIDPDVGDELTTVAVPEVGAQPLMDVETLSVAIDGPPLCWASVQ